MSIIRPIVDVHIASGVDGSRDGRAELEEQTDAVAPGDHFECGAVHVHLGRIIARGVFRAAGGE